MPRTWTSTAPPILGDTPAYRDPQRHIPECPRCRGTYVGTLDCRAANALMMDATMQFREAVKEYEQA